MGTRIRLTGIIALVAAAFILTQCGGGGGSNPPAQTTAKGVITGFGSVFVNGVEYDTSGAVVTIDDSAGTEGGLRIGMEVTVKGTGTTADSVTAADSAEGPVSNIDIALHTFEVLGQTVQTDVLTIFESTTDLTTLADGDIVEVSGPVDGLGVIHATRVELKDATPAPTTPIEVKGVVSNLTSTTFTIGSLIVSYATATLEDFPAGGLANDQFVEVKSTVGQYDAVAGTLIADTVELEPGLDAAEGEHVELEGFVTDYVSKSDFKVNGVSVDASNVSVSGIANNVRIEVEGTINADGVLVASSVEIEQESDAGLEGDITAIDTAAGTVTLLGIMVTVNATTELKDSSAAELVSFSLSDLAVDDHVEIAGYMDAGGDFIATKLERMDPSTQAMIQGVVTAKTANTSLTILGIAVSAGIPTSYQNTDGITPMNAADFFAAITVDSTVVKAQWDVFTTLTKPADELELES